MTRLQFSPEMREALRPSCPKCPDGKLYLKPLKSKKWRMEHCPACGFEKPIKIA